MEISRPVSEVDIETLLKDVESVMEAAAKIEEVAVRHKLDCGLKEAMQMKVNGKDSALAKLASIIAAVAAILTGLASLVS